MTPQTSLMHHKTNELYEFAESLVRGPLPAGAKMAAVIAAVAEPTEVELDVSFVATVARNRGFRVELFDRHADALNWLRQ
jgi:hypothetical protein